MKIENLNAGYQKKIVVRGLNIDVRQGEIISLIGPNGGGKSTLLKSISGELDAIGGSVFIGEDEIKNIPLKELARKMSIVNSQRVTPEHMNAFDVVMSGRLPYSDRFGFGKKEDEVIAQKSCELMNIDCLLNTPFTSLSDGQKQRTLIARAICQEPEYLIMDEPTSYLDIRHRLELMDVIRKLSEQKITIIMSLHELELALEISDRVLLVKADGTTMCETTSKAIESGVIKQLYGLTDEMYERVKRQLPKTMHESDERELYGDKLEKNEKTKVKQVNPANNAEDIDKQRQEFGNISAKRRHSSYFLNKECEYYPCHKLPEDEFSCMFCYCPLYDVPECGGTYTLTSKGIKNCMDCTFPHERDNYGAVIKKLKEKMYGKS